MGEFDTDGGAIDIAPPPADDVTFDEPPGPIDLSEPVAEPAENGEPADVADSTVDPSPVDLGAVDSASEAADAADQPAGPPVEEPLDLESIDAPEDAQSDAAIDEPVDLEESLPAGHASSAEIDAEGDLGGKTHVGWEFLPDDDKPFAQDVPEYPGEYLIDLHGSPDSVQVGDESLGAAEFGQLVASETDWDGSTPIRLFSCDTAADPGGFAQQLSDELGVDVTAPTAPVWSVKGGEPVVTDVDPDTGEPIDPPTGGWVTAHPKGR